MYLKESRFWLTLPTNCTAHIPERWGLRVESCLGESIWVDFFWRCTQKYVQKNWMIMIHDLRNFAIIKSRYPERPKVVGSETCSFWGGFGTSIFSLLYFVSCRDKSRHEPQKARQTHQLIVMMTAQMVHQHVHFSAVSDLVGIPMSKKV